MNKAPIKYKKFLVENVLFSQNHEFDNITINTLDRILDKKAEVPIVFACVSTNSIAGGIEGTIRFIEEYIQKNNSRLQLKIKGSLGWLDIEPLVYVQLPGKNRIVFKNANEENIQIILDSILNSVVPTEFTLGQFKLGDNEHWENVPFMDELDFFNAQKRIVYKNIGLINPECIDEYIATGGYVSLAKAVSRYTPEELCRFVEKSELRGRGGGGYSTGKKWLSTFNEISNQKFVICNADESDPGAFMDRMLIENDPHKLLEGIAIAAYAVGATKAYIYIRNKYKLSIERLEKAIDHAHEYGLLGHNILDSGFNLDIQIRKGAGAYVCGEESALIKSLEGKRAMPQSKPPYPSKHGLHGKPTLINNAETLANIPVIIEKGTDWFKDLGVAEARGTKTFSAVGSCQNLGAFEVELGTKLKDIVYHLLGGIKNDKQFKAIHLGGPSGGIVSKENLDTPIEYSSLREIGTDIGSGGMVILDENKCVIDFIKYYANFLQNESCGKCIPCREGSRKIYDIFYHITRKPMSVSKTITLERFKGVIELEGLAQVMKDTSLCGLGQTAAMPVLSSLRWFRDEYEEHIFDRYCKAGECKDLRTFIIDVEKCTGCTICAKKCPEGAIIGTQRNPYFIVENKCNGCGICYQVCKFGAISLK